MCDDSVAVARCSVTPNATPVMTLALCRQQRRARLEARPRQCETASQHGGRIGNLARLPDVAQPAGLVEGKADAAGAERLFEGVRVGQQARAVRGVFQDGLVLNAGKRRAPPKDAK